MLLFIFVSKKCGQLPEESGLRVCGSAARTCKGFQQSWSGLLEYKVTLHLGGAWKFWGIANLCQEDDRVDC